jgi:hypothetical protein
MMIIDKNHQDSSGLLPRAHPNPVSTRFNKALIVLQWKLEGERIGRSDLPCRLFHTRIIIMKLPAVINEQLLRNPQERILTGWQ